MNDFRVYIVDDDASVLDSTRRLLKAEGADVRAFGSAENFMRGYNSDDVACLVLDMRLPGMNGLELLDWLKTNKIDMPVIVMSGHGDVPAVVDSMKHGAAEYLEKPTDPRVLIEKVREMATLAQARAAEKAKRHQMRETFDRLTHREKELLEHLARGLSSKQIAVMLGISTKTVENHRSHMLAKTGAVNVASLVRMKMLLGDEVAVA